MGLKAKFNGSYPKDGGKVHRYIVTGDKKEVEAYLKSSDKIVQNDEGQPLYFSRKLSKRRTEELLPTRDGGGYFLKEAISVKAQEEAEIRLAMQLMGGHSEAE